MKAFIQMCFLTFLCLTFLDGCSSRDAWQTVTIRNGGTISIPVEWQWEKEDDCLRCYVDGTCVLVESTYEYIQDEAVQALIGDIIDQKWVRDIYFSNSAGVCKYQFTFINGDITEGCVISIEPYGDYNNYVYLLCFDSNVSWETLQDIAKSYEPA